MTDRDEKVVDLPCITTLDIPAEKILRKAARAGLTSVVVIGYDAEGDEYFASSVADGADVVFMLERARYKLMRMIDEG